MTVTAQNTTEILTTTRDVQNTTLPGDTIVHRGIMSSEEPAHPVLPPGEENQGVNILQYYNEVWRAFPDALFGFEHIIAEGNNAACMFSLTGIQKGDFLGVPPSNKEVRVDGMIFIKIKDSKIVERWEVIDIISAAKQLSMKQQLFAIKNAILEYGEVQANNDLKQKISGLFGKHLT